METLSIALATAWVLFCLAAGICAAAAVLARTSGRAMRLPDVRAAFVWTWLVAACGVPLAAAVHGFNWVTALLIAAAWPAAVWLIHCRGAYRATFHRLVRTFVLGALTAQRIGVSRVGVTEPAVMVLAAPWQMVLPLVVAGVDLRPSVPTDFDTLLRTRELLAGMTTWDPLAALTALLVRLAASDPLTAAVAVRLALVTLTPIATAWCVAPWSRRRWTGPVVAVAIVALAPEAPANTWAVVLAAILGASDFVAWLRDARVGGAWHAGAAFVLAVGLLIPFSDDIDVLTAVRSTGQHLEYEATARAVRRLTRTVREPDWIVIGPPELKLEMAEGGQFYDLARFVARFHDRTADPRFRFDLPGRRLFVFVEKRAFDAGGLTRGVRFVAAQPASYRVTRERQRLESLAKDICDEYRRTHARAAVVYDDAVLRVYRFDV